MTNTLNEFRIDALTPQISVVINKYLGETHIVQVDSQKIKPDGPEIIRDKIVKGKFSYLQIDPQTKTPD